MSRSPDTRKLFAAAAGHILPESDWRTVKETRPPAEAASFAQRSWLLRYALDGVRTEFRVLVADFPVFLVFLRIAPGLNFFHAVPHLHGNARFRRRPFDRSDLSASGEDTTAGRLDRGLNFRDILLHISFLIRHVDFRDVVDGRLGLSVKAQIG